MHDWSRLFMNKYIFFILPFCGKKKNTDPKYMGSLGPAVNGV